MVELPIDRRIHAFHQVGAELRSWLERHPEPEALHPGADPISDLVTKQQLNNPWFTPEQVLRALKEWAGLLEENRLRDWVKDKLDEDSVTKRVALIPAGNIPLVGFHDVLSILMSGHALLLRPSTDDPDLIPFLLLLLQKEDPDFEQRIRIADGKLNDFDAIIATGSNNSARYFEYYFGKYPHIIRKNRTSVAVLDGNETEEELEGIAEDIMAYFGLGCRSITKLYVPKDFDLDRLFAKLYAYKHYLDCKPYSDNYDYHRSLWMMNKVDFLENGFLMLREEEALHSAVSTLNYSRYTDIDSVKSALQDQKDELQTVVTHIPDLFERSDAPGMAQHPRLDDYADGVDTLAFLAKV